MPSLSYPDELKKSHWDKKKGELAGAGAVEALLSALQKKHEAVDWPKLADGWARGLQDEAALKAGYEALDKLYRTRVTPLKLEANALAAAAEKAAKAKEASKALKASTAQIAKQVQAYAKAVDAIGAKLEDQFNDARKSLADSASAKDDDDESQSALLAPAGLLKQLKLCKADPARAVNFAFLDDGKSDPSLGVHPRTAGAALMKLLVKELAIKTGAYGRLSVDDSVLKLVVEKKFSGLVKRIRIPVRACGFRISKVILVSETGDLLDEDHEQEEPAVTAQADNLEAAFTSRLRELLPQIQKAIDEKHPNGEQAKLRASEAGLLARKKQFAAATRLLQEAQASMAGAQQPAASSAPKSSASALAEWQKARGKVVEDLRKLGAAIVASKYPDASRGIIMLQAIIKNLTTAPGNKQSVAELQRYLETDDIIVDVESPNPFGLEIDIRHALLAALAPLKEELAA